jgi:hypothetical protein
MNIRTNDASPEYEEFLLRLIELSNRDPSCGITVAVTSPNHSDGVSYVTNMLRAELQLMSVAGVMNVRLGDLEKAQSAADVFAAMKRVDRILDEETSLQPSPTKLPGPWNHSLESRRRLVRELSNGARVVLIDCPPLREGNRTMIAAGVVDSVILVVQARVTTRDDILFAERKIQASGGKLEGYILNKVRTKSRWGSKPR